MGTLNSRRSFVLPEGADLRNLLPMLCRVVQGDRGTPQQTFVDFIWIVLLHGFGLGR